MHIIMLLGHGGGGGHIANGKIVRGVGDRERAVTEGGGGGGGGGGMRLVMQ